MTCPSSPTHRHQPDRRSIRAQPGAIDDVIEMCCVLCGAYGSVAWDATAVEWLTVRPALRRDREVRA